MMRSALVAPAAALLLAAACQAPPAGGAAAGAATADTLVEPAIAFAPRGYVVYRAPGAITVDGRLDEPGWAAAPWTDDFTDIEGPSRPAPRHATRAKLLWDSTHLYVGAWLEEPDAWATITRRDAVIFHDNDFEVFIDPDGDTHRYYELEVNALGTAWDLFLPRPYRDGGPAVDSWDIQGLRVGVRVAGTLNRPGDRDSGWSVELALPWTVLEEAAPGGRAPGAGERWRINFSRVQWRTRVEDGRYVKLTDSTTGRPLAEDNWVWSPQGLVNMHYPEMWGVAQFSDAVAGRGSDSLRSDPADAVRWLLRLVYYRERNHLARHGAYTGSLRRLGLARPPLAGRPWPPNIQVTPAGFEASLATPDGRRLTITEDGAVR